MKDTDLVQLLQACSRHKTAQLFRDIKPLCEPRRTASLTLDSSDDDSLELRRTRDCPERLVAVPVDDDLDPARDQPRLALCLRLQPVDEVGPIP